MKRRGFLAALASVPFLRRFARAAPAAAPQWRQSFVVGPTTVFEFHRGMMPNAIPELTFQFPEAMREVRNLVVSDVDYAAGTSAKQDPEVIYPRLS